MKSIPQPTNAPSRSDSTAWRVPAALVLLSAIPLAAGAFRLSQLAGGAEITPDNARFFASPLPVVLHVVSVALYALLGAFQFVPSLRRRRHRWHRAAGLIVIPSGLVAALSGLWMTLFYPMPAHDGVLVYGLRLLFGSGMLLALLLGVAALRRRAFVLHGNWMLRAYAIGIGAGTQVLTGTVAGLLVDQPTELSRALLMGAGWVINLAVAERIIRRRSSRPARTLAAAGPYKNAGDILEQVIQRNHQGLRLAARTIDQEAAPAPTTVVEAAQPPLPSPRPPHTQEKQNLVQESPARQRRLARYKEVTSLAAKGLGPKAIGQRVGLTRQTVARWLRAGGFPERPPLPPRRMQITPYEPYLRERWQAGEQNSRQVWRELRAKGFTGGSETVRRLTVQWRTERGRSGPPKRQPRQVKASAGISSPGDTPALSSPSSMAPAEIRA